MYEKPVLSLADTQAAMKAMLEEAIKRPDHAVAIAMVDEGGDLIGYAKMDNCDKLAQRLAVRKAYTSAMFGRDTQERFDMLLEEGRNILEYTDPNMIGAPGGVGIVRPSDGAKLGGIGVSGIGGPDNEALGHVGLKALNLS